MDEPTDRRNIVGFELCGVYAENRNRQPHFTDLNFVEMQKPYTHNKYPGQKLQAIRQGLAQHSQHVLYRICLQLQPARRILR